MQAVLFDLDGTLLDIDVDTFLKQYFAAIRPVLSEVTGDDADRALAALLDATNAMCRSHPGVTNRDVFAQAFGGELGMTLEDVHWDRFDRFYAEDFPALQGAHGPRPLAREAVTTALELGYRVAIATNPIFPRVAIDERMRWAGVDDLDVHHVTSFEISTACKPDARYFLEVADVLGVAPSDCLMVGDDPSLDLPASDTGMRTYYVGPPMPTSSTWSGDFGQLRDLLVQLAPER